jgi:hypothetical protein
MDTTSIGNLFGNVPAKIIDAIGPLEQTVSTTPPYEKDVSLDTGNKSLDLFGTPISVDATLSAKVQAGALTQVPFADDQITVNGMYASLAINGAISASGTASAKQGVLQLSANASANASFNYQHYLPVDGSRTRLAAFIDLAKTTSLPQLADPKSIVKGEVLDFKAAFGVDFGLKATYGATLGVADTFHLFAQLTDGLSFPFTVHAALAVSAAFGFALDDTMRYTIGCLGLTDSHADWVRIRIERANKKTITFSLAINLTIDYDATSGAQMLLDKAFALVPMPQVIKTLQEVSTLAAGSWNDFKQKVSNEAAIVIGRLVDDSGWENLVAASPAINDMIVAANKIVTLYDGIDTKVKSVFEELISKLNATELGKLEPIIQQVAAIDVDNLDLTSLLDQQEQDIVHWIEVLSGQNLEELVITGNVKPALTRAVTLAKQIETFLSGGGASAAVAKVNAILNKSGATAFVAWLQKNATSVQALQNAGDQAVGDIVRRLVGKELNAITLADVARIQKFATDLNNILTAPQQLHDKLQKGIQKLKGTIGFNVSLELTRVSENSAILDVEIDPTNSAVVSAVKSALRGGDVKQFLATLNAIRASNTDAPAYPYLIREAILISRQIRTSAMSTVVSFLGFTDQTLETRLVETTINIYGGGTAAPGRDATYNGGVSVRRFDGAVTSEGAASLRITASGPGTDTDSAYDTATPALRLTYTRQDTKTDSTDVEAIRQLLLDFAVTTNLNQVTTNVLQGKQSNLALAIEFTPPAVTALIAKDAKGWERDALNAAHRWFADPDRTPMEVNPGRDMSAAVITQSFGRHWTDFMGVTPGDGLFTADLNDEFGVEIFANIDGQKRVKSQYNALGLLLGRRKYAADGFANYSAVPSSKNPKDLLLAATQAARLFDTLQSQWQPPLFNFWLVFARLLRQPNNVIAGARGLVTLRTRDDSNSDWEAPTSWVLDPIDTTLLKQWFPL